MRKVTVETLKKLYKKCKEFAIPRTDDGKYYILDNKARKAYNKKIKEKQ